MAGKLGTGWMTADGEAIAQSDLRQVFALEQGVPVAVGSGKASLKYKLRAVSHSIKLNCKSWRRTAEQLNHTATWVGDLGEVGVVKLKTNLKTIMGNWIVDADSNGDTAAADSEFDVVDQD